MKKTTLIAVAVLFAMASVALLCGCQHDKNCKPPFSREEVPFIYDNDYHNCMDVLKNIVYLSKGYSESYLKRYPYPFPSHTEDTIKVCGYIVRWSHGGVFDYEGDWWSCYLTDDSFSATGETDPISSCFQIQGDHMELLDGVDSRKKCYLTGFLTFNNPFQYHSIGGPTSWDQCVIVEPRLQVVEIHN